MRRRRANCGWLTTQALATTILAVVAGGATALGQDADTGLALAQDLCADCHTIGPVGQAKRIPPDFAEIARYRPADWIRGFIIAPHPVSPMPTELFNVLDADELDDIVAYVVSLERGAAQ